MEIQSESVMKSATKSFFRGFMKTLGFSLGLGVVLFLFSSFSNKDLIPPPSLPTLLPDAQGERKLLPMHSPAILVLKIDNVIGMGDLTTEKVKNLLIDSRNGILDNNRVKGILLHINSGGGSATDSDDIYSMIMQYKKEHKVPVYGYVDGLCGSGAMYIASSCDKIFSTPTSIIGSVGVRIGPMFNLVGTMEKYGVTSQTLTEGKNKDMFNSFRAWTPNEGVYIQQAIAGMYERFVEVVLSARRKMTRDALVNQYGAGIFLAPQAEMNGYIDEANANYEIALSELAKASNIQDGEAYQVVQLSTPHSIFEQFSQAKIETMIRNILGLPSTELQNKILFM